MLPPPIPVPLLPHPHPPSTISQTRPLPLPCFSACILTVYLHVSFICFFFFYFSPFPFPLFNLLGPLFVPAPPPPPLPDTLSQLYCSIGIFTMENSGSFPRGKLAATVLPYSTHGAWCSSVSIVHRTLTWTTGSLTCVFDFRACIYTLDIGLQSHRKDFRGGTESAQNLTTGKLAREAWHETVTHPCSDHAQSC